LDEECQVKIELNVLHLTWFMVYYQNRQTDPSFQHSPKNEKLKRLCSTGMEGMEISVEFTSIARILTGVNHVNLQVEPHTTFLQVLEILAKQYPQLVGQLIDPQTYRFYASNLFSINGQRMLRDDEMDSCPNDGDRLIVMSLLAGG
jgi:redox-sensitive bicupin YhaK (pirin superfamily)